MHIAHFYLTNDKAPVSGQSIYVVCDETDRTIKLLHPFTLTAFDITHAEYRAADEKELWPNAYDMKIHGQEAKYDETGHKISPFVPINEQVCLCIERHVAEGTKPFSAMLIRRVLAALRGVKLETVPLIKETGSVPRGFAVRNDKRPGIIDAIDEALATKGGVSVDECLEKLITLFPERASEGMRTTIRCQINRLPGKKARKLNSHFDNERGKVYEWAAA